MGWRIDVQHETHRAGDGLDLHAELLDHPTDDEVTWFHNETVALSRELYSPSPSSQVSVQTCGRVQSSVVAWM